jgi:hypothetical protein
MKKIKEEIVTYKDSNSDEINFISYLKITYPDGTIETSVPFDHRYEFERNLFRSCIKDEEETSEQFKKRFNKEFFDLCNIITKAQNQNT